MATSLRPMYMGGCPNYGSPFGCPKNFVPYYIRDPNRDNNFDNHPYTLGGPPHPVIVV